MQKEWTRLTMLLVVPIGLLTVLGAVGFWAISGVPAQESHLGSLRVPFMGFCLAAPLLGAAVAAVAARSVSGEMALYEQILDAIPFPITVTDINMKWLFVNKPVCDMLGKKRGEFFGKHCSSWGAAICNTDNCGIACLRNGKASTTFTQFGSDFHVDVFYLTDSKGNKNGHIELVRDITTESTLKKQQHATVTHLVTLSDSFTAAAGQITDGSRTLADGATEQAASIEGLSESVAELGRMAKDNTEATTAALGEVQEAGRLMTVCQSEMLNMLEAMRTINEKSQNISKTTKVIDDIAFQTNILALNAAVEAARAGQHGKGFAVVAEEVRNLASKSAEAAKETAALVASSFQSVTGGNEIVEKVNDSLNAVMAGSQKNAAQIAEVQAVSMRQSEAMELIAADIERMSHIVLQNSATAAQLASTSADMNGHTQRLHTTILTLGDGNTPPNRPLLSEGT